MSGNDGIRVWGLGFRSFGRGFGGYAAGVRGDFPARVHKRKCSTEASQTSFRTWRHINELCF